MAANKNRALVILGYVFLAFVLVATALFVAIYLALTSMHEKTTWSREKKPEIIENIKAPDIYQYHPRTNFLVLGLDNNEGISRTDAVVVVSVDERNANAALISLPRDTKLVVDGKTERLNAVLPKKGRAALIKTVEDILNIPIHYYVQMDYHGFERIIDTLGGVIIDVEMPMVYDDYSQKLHIRIMPGKQRLNGEQALHYVRYRGDGYGDISLTNAGYVGRVSRQQKFIEALVNEVSRPSNLGKLPNLVPKLKDAIRTNLTPTEMVKWATLAQSARGFQIKNFVLPGNSDIINQASYWVADKQRLESIVNEYFRVGRYGFSVGILNGSGSTEVAKETAQKLREKGFKIAGITEVTEYQYQKTTIQANADCEEAVKWLAASMGIKDYEWSTSSSPLGDVAILLGRDAIKK
jgi:LCP family protein required for cell wall assembly